MNNRSIFLSIACITISLLCSVSCAKIKIIRFATTGLYAPFSKLYHDGALRGFDIDIAKEVCKRTHAQCVFYTDNVSNMVGSLKANKYDACISAISITEDRKQNIDFSDVYFSGMAKLLATNNSTFSAIPAEMKNKIIGVENGTRYIPYINNTYGDTVEIKIFPTRHDSCAALKEGKVDAVIDDVDVLKSWRTRHNCMKQYRLIGLPAKHLNMINQQYAIAVAKGNTFLLQEINKALAEIKSDGTYDQIIIKHFNF